ncbi:BON domain-containing protein [Aquincola sp. J276]|uniref:BON domain-containing protein n=1 Tax=Aquincola sp. J276 TaxID=2898432 RepID=UPI002151E336|nr:BON domain-containing protein [Aquincola sp. J276]MCR5865018.1 BON domain-containing protein [Aquincola sp. J276]
MQATHRNRLAIVASAAALTFLTACSPRSDDTAATGTAGGTVASTEPAPVPTTPSTTPPATTTDSTTTTAGSGNTGSTMDNVGDAARSLGNAAENAAGNVASATGDASLTAKVKTALITAPDLGSLNIDVDTANGVVTLNGEVKNANEKTKAEQVASTVIGVTSVVNKLQVANS